MQVTELSNECILKRKEVPAAKTWTCRSAAQYFNP